MPGLPVSPWPPILAPRATGPPLSASPSFLSAGSKTWAGHVSLAAWPGSGSLLGTMASSDPHLGFRHPKMAGRLILVMPGAATGCSPHPALDEAALTHALRYLMKTPPTLRRRQSPAERRGRRPAHQVFGAPLGVGGADRHWHRDRGRAAGRAAAPGAAPLLFLQYQATSGIGPSAFSVQLGCADGRVTAQRPL